MAETSDRKALSFKWDFYINGEVLSPERKKCVQSLEYSNPVDSSDLLTLNICDPDMVFLQDDLFVEDAVVKCNIFFEGVEEKVEFDGYVVALDPDFPEEGVPSVKVYCIDNTHLMDKKKIKKTWKNKTRPQIVAEILKKYGYTLSVGKGYTFRKVKSVSQSNVTDIAFCESLAADEPDLFYFKLMGKVGYLGRYAVAKDFDQLLSYRGAPYDILSFTPQITKAQIEVKEKESKITPEYGDLWATTTTAEEQGVPSGATSPLGSDSTVNSVYNHDTGEWEQVRP